MNLEIKDLAMLVAVFLSISSIIFTMGNKNAKFEELDERIYKIEKSFKEYSENTHKIDLSIMKLSTELQNVFVRINELFSLLTKQNDKK